ncbi:claudin-10 [Gadus morhua]|uniref:Claudin n=1 Tax=Gadus morhua TaxID=8049 RepID=A0A8C5BWD2_GADMO|nr:claudin-10-like [Gadus morhua]
MSGVQILALLGGLVGLGATIGATVSNEWRVTSRASSVITATWVLQGLWNNCAGNALGALHCRPHHTLLKLDGYVQACRGLMVAAVCLGFFGSVFVLVGMKCTTIGGTDKSKARLACVGGVNFIVSGLCSLSACSLYAHWITAEFFDPVSVSQKYEMGAALFVGWGGALLCLAGGVTLFFSSVGSCTDRRPQSRYVYKGAGTQSHVTSATREPLRPAGQRPPHPKGSTSSGTKNFDKSVYV